MPLSVCQIWQLGGLHSLKVSKIACKSNTLFSQNLTIILKYNTILKITNLKNNKKKINFILKITIYYAYK